MKLGCLKSGTDLRGVASGEDVQLTKESAKAIAQGFYGWLLKQGYQPPVRIAVGRDSRISGPDLQHWFSQELQVLGAQVLSFGLCTTPAMYLCLSDSSLSVAASVMITASHHPENRNGFKFFQKKGGGLTGAELDEVLIEAESGKSHLNAQQMYPIETVDYLKIYQEHLTDIVLKKLDTDIAKPLLGLHVVVDAGNGAGGFYACWLESLGAWIEGSQYLQPDGRFPNHIPNPENPEAMASICKAVERSGADMGVIFDADCDRAAIVDNHGKPINRNRLIALVSAVLLNNEPGATIVTDSVTSSGLAKFIGEWGGIQYRYKRGYRNVINEALRLNRSGINCPLAIETSGHAAYRENAFMDDGMYLSTLLICEAMLKKQEGEDLFSLLNSLREPIESAELRLDILEKDFHNAGTQIISEVMDFAVNDPDCDLPADNREGVRINFDLNGGMENAWLLLRLSVHDPVMPLNLESDIKGGVIQMLNKLYPVIADFDSIDTAPIRNYLEKHAKKEEKK